MASVKTSITLQPRDLDKFRSAADERGISLSVFLARCATVVLTPPDLGQDFKRLSSDLRADLTHTINRIAETNALGAESQDQALAELRDLLTGFLHELKDQQVAVVLGAYESGRRASPKDLTAEQLGFRPNPNY